MANRLLDAHAVARVVFSEGGVTQEFVARFTTGKLEPMVVGFEKNVPHKGGKGGLLTIEARREIQTFRRVIDPLPDAVEAEIDRWLEEKRRDLMAAASKKVAKGASYIKINPVGEVKAK